MPDRQQARDMVTEIINARPTGPGPRKSVVGTWLRGSA
jgi:hypothetical protein